MELVTARRLLAAYAMLDGHDRLRIPRGSSLTPGETREVAAGPAGETRELTAGPVGETQQVAAGPVGEPGAAAGPEHVLREVTGLLFRLTALTAAHGPDIPATLLDTLASSSGAPLADGAVQTVLSFLETGRRPGEAAHTGDVLRALRRRANGSQSPARRPDDDLCCATRDRDLPPGAAGTPSGPDPLPPSLKALAASLSTIRSRLPREPPLPGPVIAGPRIDRQVDRATVLISPPDRGYALLVAGERLRSARRIAALLHDLRPCLAPSDAAWVLWAHVHQEQPGEALDFLLVTHDGAPQTVRWAYRPWPHQGRDPIRLCRDRLPSVDPVPAHGQILVAGAGDPVTVRALARGIVEVVAERATAAPARALVYSPASAQPPGLSRSARRAADLVAARLVGAFRGWAVASVASGHVRLDRALGPEQETATAIGGAVLRRLLDGAPSVPLAAAQMDDDGPLVRLSPRDYRAYLRLRLPPSPLALVPGSSPLVRSIAAVLYDRLLTLDVGHRVQRHGAGLFIDLGDGCFRELVADARPARSTGGLLLEAALLTYRTDPARFDAYFQDRFGLPGDPHRAIADILDAGWDHQETARRLADLERTFAPVTGWESADPGVLALVRDVLAEAGPGVIHINVLDDFYAAQQERVRALALLLRLPFRLLSLHYSIARGDVFLHD
ncbi:hypothetical protein ACIGXF_34060 [Streptomyces sp. NPDC053086]|uniref:hypothetical protein n=1 Tax=unclassified Streptomyces TaxID=2593676 RepID=UPI0037CDB374